jgi:RimJ/RimL family protein N-acetyltransferase
MTRGVRREGIEGTRIRLTPILLRDSRTLFRWINDRELVLFNAGFHPVHATQHAAWMRSVASRQDVVVFAIRQKRSAALVGVCQLHTISPVHRSAELQIRIGESKSRGRGYGREAVRLLVDFAFRDLNLHRLWLRVFRSNARALKTYAAAGFVQEGILRDGAFIDGRYVDVIIMGITQRD